MRILLMSASYNSLTQRAHTELLDIGHEVTYRQATQEEQDWQDAIRQLKPDVIIAPFLKTAIPVSVRRQQVCIIIHPGIKGDRGPASLDRAILERQEEWGVTLLQADREINAGDIWAARTFRVPEGSSKSRLYRHEVAQAAMDALHEVMDKLQKPKFRPYAKPDVRGKLHRPVEEAERQFHWTDAAADIVCKIRSADSQPGVLGDWFGEQYYMYGAHEEDALSGRPGELLAVRDGAVCRATGDGAVWITHLKREGGIKLPAALVLEGRLEGVRELPLGPFQAYPVGGTYRELRYEEADGIGYVHFDFYNGAMSTDQCRRLQRLIAEAKKRDIRVLVLMGGADFWSNGIHLNMIEHAADPGGESWNNSVAMNDLVQEIIETDKQFVIAAMQGNASAGGVMLALAADRVYAREGIVLNPHYRRLGGLYGSEYWTYLLPRRVGDADAYWLTGQCPAISTTQAIRIGLLDDAFGDNSEDFIEQIRELAVKVAGSRGFRGMLAEKKQNRAKDEAVKPLWQYRDEELKQMWSSFNGPDDSYHRARNHFVYKLSCSPRTLTSG